ncbi:MAG: VWA domain-containing protein [Ignavibacteria bacterium]|nr:VWA domain-containing protein [Ignavibacteria bacterium]
MKKIIIAALLLTSVNIFADTENQFVFLFDNSGSMLPFYIQPQSTFKTFCKALIKNSVKKDDKADVMLFTKTDPGRGIVSPKVLFSGESSGMIMDDLMSKFTLTTGKDNLTGTTDLIEALDKGISAIKGSTGIIWLITDNINDNTGTGDSSYLNTLEFYKKLRSDGRIQKILLFPFPEVLVEGSDTTKGYVAYGIVYSKNNLSQKELEYYDGVLRGAGIKNKAITLKPLDIGTIVLKPKVTQSRITEGKLFYDGSTLRGFGFEEGEKVNETFNDLSLKSNLYPYIIKSAKLHVGLEKFSSSDYSVKSLGTQTISPSTVSNVSPEGEVTGFSVIFNLPEITPNFSFNTIFKEDFSIGGDLVLDVSDVDILLDQNYVNNFRELFALQSVPEIFQPVLKDKKIVTKIPLEIRMKYGPWRLFVLIGLIALVILLILAFVYLLMRKKCFTLVIDNAEEQDLCLSGISSYTVSNYTSGDLGQIKKSLTGELSFIHSKNTSSPNSKVKLVYDIPVEIEYDEDGIRKKTVSIMIRKTDKGSSSGESITGETGIY